MTRYILTCDSDGYWTVTIDDEVVYSSYDIEDCTTFITQHQADEYMVSRLKK